MSLKGDKYETAEEVKFRLEGTIVLYDGKPVYINRVQGSEIDEDGNKEIARVYFFPLPWNGLGGEATRKYLSSRKFELTPFKMGYFNHEGEALFVSRTPVRQARQGLSNANAIITTADFKKSMNASFNTLMSSPGFVDMVNGKYPQFSEIRDLLGDKESSSVAIGRPFAVKIDHDLEALMLLNRGVRCGIALKGDRSIKVPAKYAFLKEEMEEHRIPIS